MEVAKGKGHPRSFKDEQEFKDKFNSYIDYCIKNERLANIAGFCVYTDITRETFYNQEQYYFDTYKKIQDILEDTTINAKINDTFKIFYMKNKFGYKDRTELDNNITANVKTTDLTHLTTEQIRELLKNEDKN